MARKLRAEYPGAIDHVMNQGDRREAIFREQADGQKVAIARRLRRETVMTVAWIGRCLQMGSRHRVANCFKVKRTIQ